MTARVTWKLKKHATGLTDKQEKNLNVQRTFWQISLPLSHEWRSQTLSKWQCDGTFSPRSDVSGYFLNPQIFVSGFKNFHVHTYPDSLSVRQLICKEIFDSRENFKSPVCFTDKIVPSSTIFQDFFFKVVLMHQLFLATTVGTWRIWRCFWSPWSIA